MHKRYPYHAATLNFSPHRPLVRFSCSHKESTTEGTQALVIATKLWLGIYSEVDTTVVSLEQVDQAQRFFCRRRREPRGVIVIPSRRIEGAKLAWGAASGRTSADEDIGRGC